MLKSPFSLSFLCLVAGGVCLSFAPANNNNNPNYNNNNSNNPQNANRSVSDRSNQYRQSNNHGTGREEVAYMDERDEDIHERANRMGDWNYRQNWRYDRKAFYSGETQGEALDKEIPEGEGGIGMSPDTEFLEMREYYLQQTRNNSSQSNDNHRLPTQQNSSQQNGSSRNQRSN